MRQVLDRAKHRRAGSGIVVHAADDRDTRVPGQVPEQVADHHAATDDQDSALLGFDCAKDRAARGPPGRDERDGKEQDRDHDRDRLQRCLPLKGAEEMIYPKHAATGDAKPVDNVVQLVEGALQNLTW